MKRKAASVAATRAFGPGQAASNKAAQGPQYSSIMNSDLLKLVYAIPQREQFFLFPKCRCARFKFLWMVAQYAL